MTTSLSESDRATMPMADGYETPCTATQGWASSPREQQKASCSFDVLSASLLCDSQQREAQPLASISDISDIIVSIPLTGRHLHTARAADTPSCVVHITA